MAEGQEAPMNKKRKKIAVPKRFAGVKVPKPMRRGLRRFAASQNGRALIAETILAAAAASQARRGSLTRKALAKHGVALKMKAGAGAQAASESVDNLNEAFQAAVRAFMDTLHARPAPAAQPPTSRPTN
jgi:hypothetical protein